MHNLFGYELKKEDLLKYFSDISLIAGASQCKYSMGKAKDVNMIRVKTGLGFRFHVIPDRGMDITYAEYLGKPISWISTNGVVSSEFYEYEGFNSERSFAGGLITTCGLTQAGSPCVDGDEKLGLHGRVSNTPAERVNIDEYWEDGDYLIRVRGKVRESCLYAENMVLNREILCKLGESKIYVHDIIENQGYKDTPFMIIYHINFGFPIVSPQSKLFSSLKNAAPLNDYAKKNPHQFDEFASPTANYLPDNYLLSDPVKMSSAYVALVNEKINLGAYLKYSPEQMPYVTLWKQLGQQEYVVGIEPGNCIPEGRAEARKNGRLVMLKPGEKKDFSFEIGVLDNNEDINQLKINCRV